MNMKNIDVKKLIVTAFAIFYFAVMNICIFYGFQYEPEYTYVGTEYKMILLVLVFAIFSSIFYFIIIHLYGDTEKFKLKTFVITLIAAALNVAYAINNYHLDKKYGTLSKLWGDTTAIIFLVIAYLFVWQKINWLNKMKQKLLNLNTYKKSRKKKNIILTILNSLTENPLIIILILLLIIIMTDLIGRRYSFGQWIEYDLSPAAIIELAMVLMSLIQLAIVLGLNAFYKNKKTIYSIIAVLLASMLIAPIAFNYDFFDYHIDIFHLKNQIERSIEDKKAASEYKKELEEELKNGPIKFLENFEIAKDIHEAKVGQVVKFGKTFVKNDISNKEDAYYYVLNKEDNILTLISLFCVDYVDNDFIYENGNKGYYDYFDNEYYKNAFNDAEKKMIVDTVAQDQNKHKVYVPSVNDLLIMDSMNNKVNLGVVNDTLMKEIRKHITVFNDHYFRGTCEYLLEPHILKPNTIRTSLYYQSVENSVIRDYDEKRQLDYHGVMSIFVRTKISVDIN